MLGRPSAVKINVNQLKQAFETI